MQVALFVLQSGKPHTRSLDRLRDLQVLLLMRFHGLCCLPQSRSTLFHLASKGLFRDSTQTVQKTASS